MSLPRPTREDRFSPLRSGLLNLYRYDDQELWFEDGRLLVRGNNGTGKSRILALQLPFLFDGEVAPHRMEPDGDTAKRAEWNLLMAGRYPDRLGYTWLELGRRAPEHPAGEEFVTLGCGLQAAAGRGLTGRWFFVTRQRIGRDLFLVTPTGHALSRERLAESIGDAGAVYTTAVAYREAVDQALFGLGRLRYEALMNLLVGLRQPQLSRQLDEQRLSAALSEALAPLPAALVADVAESFRGLESDRDALESFRTASRAVEQFLAEYRRYAQMAARRRAQILRTQHSAYEAALRDLRLSEREVADAEQAGTVLDATTAQAKIDEEAASATASALAASPAMADAQALRRAREAATRAEADVIRGQAAADKGAETSRRHQAEQQQAEADAVSARLELAACAERLRRAAAAIGIEARHLAVTANLDEDASAADGAAADRLPPLLRALGELLEDRRRALRHLRALRDSLRASDAAVEGAEAAARSAEADVADATDAQRRAADDLQRAAEALREQYRVWSAQALELAPPALEVLVDALAAWCAEPGGPSPIATATAASLSAALERLAAERSGVETRLGEARALLEALRQEKAQLEAGVHRPPPVPHTRDEAARQQREGAPLWRLVDFSDDVTAENRAGLEAALEAAGILDAWVTPEGRLLGADETDVLLVVDGSRLPNGVHLGSVLRAAVDSRDARAAAVSAERLAALLSQIGMGADAASTCWVSSDGRFRIGPLDGRWTKPTAEHIGEGARQETRRRRLDALAVELEAADAEERRIVADLAAVGRRTDAAKREAASVPNDQPLRVAGASIEACSRTLQTLRSRLADAQANAGEARAARARHRAAYTQSATDVGLGGWLPELEGLEDAVSAYGAEIAALGPTLRQHHAAARRHDDSARRTQEAENEAAAAAAHVLELRGQAAALAADRDVLDSTVGAAAEDILARYAQAQKRVKALRAMRDDLAQQEHAALERTIRARSTGEQARTTVATTEEDRDRAAAGLARLAGTRLLGVALPDPPEDDPQGWSTTRTVELARRIEAALERIDASDAAWERSGKGLFSYVQTLEQALLPHGHQATTGLADDLVVVEVPFQGQTHTVAAFGKILAAEVVSRQMLLGAREREVLENHLVGEVSMHLHESLHAAERLVRQMNDELAARPMSTGMTLRFSWKPVEDGPSGLPEARKRLMRAGGTWTAAERDGLGAFLQQRIAAVRAANLAGSWQDDLAEALDYRRWHHFGVERLQDGDWKRLTRRTHGTGSGGEKAVALTLPQFAAAAAHYRSASPTAPRLILLDEVFVGVDSDMRSKCMGLLTTFDLDFVMTSEREWGCYPTVPGLAIYQLATRPGIDAVGVTRFVWNGRERRRVEPPVKGARAATTGSDEAAHGLPLADPAP